MTRKPAKTDIAAIEFLLADLDPKQDETSKAGRSATSGCSRNSNQHQPQSLTSGNGIQVLLKLAEPIMLAEPANVTNAKGKSEKCFPTRLPRRSPRSSTESN